MTLTIYIQGRDSILRTGKPFLGRFHILERTPATGKAQQGLKYKIVHLETRPVNREVYQDIDDKA